MTARREGRCDKCGRDYTVWFAPNAVWNRVCRGSIRANPDEYSFLCLDCFALLAEERGVKPTRWALTPDFAGILDPELRVHLHEARAVLGRISSAPREFFTFSDLREMAGEALRDGTDPRALRMLRDLEEQRDALSAVAQAAHEAVDAFDRISAAGGDMRAHAEFGIGITFELRKALDALDLAARNAQETKT